MQAHADPPGVDALLDAAEAGNMDRVRELLDGGDVGVNDADADACLVLPPYRLAPFLSCWSLSVTSLDLSGLSRFALCSRELRCRVL